MVLLLFLAFIVACMLLDYVVQLSTSKSKPVEKASFSYPQSMESEMCIVPKGISFDKTHTWAFQELNGNIRIGLDDFLVRIIGKLSRVVMKKEGELVRKGDHLVTLNQNGKTLTINSPVSGTIVLSNVWLNDHLSNLKRSPYNDGWLYIVEPLEWSREQKFLLQQDRYKEWIKKEVSRLKDFLAKMVKYSDANQMALVLQDGGVLREDVLENFGPEEWEIFQSDFLNK